MELGYAGGDSRRVCRLGVGYEGEAGEGGVPELGFMRVTGSNHEGRNDHQKTFTEVG